MLQRKYRKWAVEQKFRQDETGKEDDYRFVNQDDWSVVLPITTTGEVVAVLQFKHGCDRMTLELPAGTKEFVGEQDRDVMIREFTEETGYRAQSIERLGYGWPMTQGSQTKFSCFLARGCVMGGTQKLDKGEDIKVELILLDRWICLCQNGAIFEPSAVMTTMRALPHLGLTISGR